MLMDKTTAENASLILVLQDNISVQTENVTNVQNTKFQTPEITTEIDASTQLVMEIQSLLEMVTAKLANSVLTQIETREFALR